MSLESFIELLNSPTGKKLDSLAKGMVIRMVIKNGLPILIAYMGGDAIAEIAKEILPHLSGKNDEII